MSSFEKLDRHLGDARANINKGLRQLEEAMAEAEGLKLAALEASDVGEENHILRKRVLELEKQVAGLNDQCLRLHRELAAAYDQKSEATP